MIGTHKAKNSPFTQYDTKNPDCDDKKSLQDSVVVSSDLKKYIDILEIYSTLKWTPSRVDKEILKYSDHFALKVVFRSLPMKRGTMKTLNKKEIKWNMRKKLGWQKY